MTRFVTAYPHGGMAARSPSSDAQDIYNSSMLNGIRAEFSSTCQLGWILYSILYQKLGGHTVLGIRLLHCTRLLGTHGYLVESGEKMISANLPIESGRAQGCFFFWKMAISDSESQFWDSGSPPRAVGHAQGCFFFLKNSNLGFWKPILGFWKPSESIGACSRLFLFCQKWQSGILEGLHTVIGYPHGY